MNHLILVESDPAGPIRNLLTALEVEAVTSLPGSIPKASAQGSALILAEQELIEWCAAATARSVTVGELLSGFTDILVYPFAGTVKGLRALEKVVAAALTSSQSETRKSDYMVTETREACGPFAGLRVENVTSSADIALRVENASCPVEFIVAGAEGSLFTRFTLPGLNIFVLSSTAVFDPSANYQRNLDVKDCFSGLVPLLFFLRHIQIRLPRSLMKWANWIIDDPNLTPKYGFLDIRKLPDAIRQSGAAATIAFIPWNYSRTSKEIVEAFKVAWPQVSICMHGCDHTASEFAAQRITDAASLIDLAIQRMKTLHRKTALSFERVMVFPQGRFSAEAMQALQASELLAAVNTELIDCRTGVGVKGHELLKPAITSFGGFPLFMRRPAEEALANFALDLLLDKPCLVVTHHQYFARGLESLQSAVKALSALEPEMVWTNLERGIQATSSIQKINETVDQSMARVSRPMTAQRTTYRIKVAARRYLTELRDNYLSRFQRIRTFTAPVEQLLGREL